MRETYGTLLQATKDYCIDDTQFTANTLSTTENFLKREINKAIRYIHSKTRIYKTQLLPKTATTVDGQIYYHYPPGVDSIESVTMTIGSVAYPLEAIDSQAEWDRLQLIEIASSTIPKYYFPREADFGVYPTPSSTDTITIVINPIPKDLINSDETTGTVTVAQNSRTVTGSGTAFTTNMKGRWFKADDDGEWYRITSVSSATVLTIESVFEGSSVSGSTFVIGESPNMPVELHELIPWRAASVYYATLRRDPTTAQKYMNYFYTGDFANNNRRGKIEGGLLGVINRYKNRGRSNNQLVRMGKRRFDYHDERWAITLTD